MSETEVEVVFIGDKPCKLMSKDIAVNDAGVLFLNTPGIGWRAMAASSTDNIHQAKVRIEERFEEQLMHRIADALDKDNDVIYIRKSEGRLLWVKGNVHGGGQKWEELTPSLAVDRLMASGSEYAEELKQQIMQQEPEAYEIGWYQDGKGDLYQFDGKTWVGKNPSKKEIEAFEFLG